MATTVDYCPPEVGVSAATVPAAAKTFYCAASDEYFASAEELRAHCKTERYFYNTKRKLNGLKPISQEAWERKLRESRAAGQANNKGTAHLKAKKDKDKDRKESVDTTTETSSTVVTVSKPSKPPPPWTPSSCLFDKKRFRSVDENLAYMWKKYQFSIPDKEYCTDVEGLLTMLHEKITDAPCVCIFCGKVFSDAEAVRNHMLEMKHTRIGTQARSCSGQINEERSEMMKAELDEFYDFTASTMEITEKIKDPAQKVGAIFRFFDMDRDDLLDRKEVGHLWKAMTGMELSDAQYAGACQKADADAEKGLDQSELHMLYKSGLADLDAHFAVLQELLTKKLTDARARAKAEEEEEDEEEDEEEEEGEEGEEEDDDSSGTEILECEDEDEFAEVMRILGMEPATITEDGDLRLPNGSIACNRDVAHIWKQRGIRAGDVVASGNPHRRSMLMISDRGDGASKLQLTRRQQEREGKRIIAVLRRAQNAQLRLGLQQNTLQKQKGLKVRTVYGDASGGR